MKLCAFLLVFAGIVDAQVYLGMRLKSTQIPKRNTSHCASTPSQTYPCLMEITLQGVRFSVVGYDAKTLGIKHLLTSDRRFITGDGLRVGSRVEIAEDKILALRGWKIYGATSEDGWRTILRRSLNDQTVQSVDGTVVDLSKPVLGRTHVFEVVGFEKGGI